jgi:hypothetical protein
MLQFREIDPFDDVSFLIVFPRTLISSYFRFAFLIIVCILLPLRFRSINYMPLATKLVANLHDFEMFISDEDCLKFFEDYLKRRMITNSTEGYFGIHVDFYEKMIFILLFFLEYRI